MMKEETLKQLQKAEVEILDCIVHICESNDLNYFLIGGTLLGAVRHKGIIPWDDDIDVAMPRNDYEKFLRIFETCNANKKFILDTYENNKLYWAAFAKVRNASTVYQEGELKDYKGNMGVWVDIFPLDNAKSDENSKKQLLQFKMAKFIDKLIRINSFKMTPKKSVAKRALCKCVCILPKKFLFWCEKKVMTLNKDEDSRYFVNIGSRYGLKKQTHLKEKYFPAVELEFEGKMYKAPRDYDYVLRKIYGDDYMELPPVEKRVTHNPIKIKFEDGEEYTFDEATNK